MAGKGVAPVLDLLLAKTVQTDGCWFWQGMWSYNGYGRQFIPGPRGPKKRVAAHRLMYQEFVGPIPDGLTLDHLCRNRGCVNPQHLEPVTIGENIRRSERVLRGICKRGHEYTPENTSYQKDGSRRCKACRRKGATRG